MTDTSELKLARILAIQSVGVLVTKETGPGV